MSQGSYGLMNQVVASAVQCFRAGEPIVVHDLDDREAESDIIYPASMVKPEDVTRLRNDAGGMVCVALPDGVADAFDLLFLADEISHLLCENGDLAYDDRLSFSLTVNHRETRTGIPNNDRALTIQELGQAAAASDSYDFTDDFRAPIHVHLLGGAPGLLDRRQGHKEMGLALARAAGRAPAVVVCEMLNGETGEALSKADAVRYADNNDLIFPRGRDLIQSLF